MRDMTAMRALRISVLIIAMVLSSTLGCLAEDPPGQEYLQPTMECPLDNEELQALALNTLGGDPVKIHNWVYENIYCPSSSYYYYYDKSRLGAYVTYLNRRGNHWDTSSLLITLLRISGIKARYVKSSYDYVYVEAWLPLDNYRGSGSGTKYGWVPMAPWCKEFRTEAGLDLFTSTTVPSALKLDLDSVDGYLSGTTRFDAVEVYENKLQSYLSANHPGKSLEDLPRKEIVVEKPLSVLPLSQPSLITAGSTYYVEVPNEYREYVTLSVLKTDQYGNPTSSMLTKTYYFPKFAGKRLSLIWRDSGGKCPVFKIDGIDDETGTSSIGANEYFRIQYQIPGVNKLRPPYKAGTLMVMSFDPLSASQKTIHKLETELEGLSKSLASSSNIDNQEQYLGRQGAILAETFLMRKHDGIVRSLELMQCRPYFGAAPTFIYTNPQVIYEDSESKAIVHPQWNIDAQTYSDMIKTGTIPQALDWNDERFELARGLYMYKSSLNESRIFEDWMDTQGLSTVKGIWLAKEATNPVNPVVEIDSLDDTADIATLQGGNLDTQVISDILSMLDHTSGTTVVTVPVRKIPYEDAQGYVYMARTPDYDLYAFKMDEGGWSAPEVVPEPDYIEIPTYILPEYVPIVQEVYSYDDTTYIPDASQVGRQPRPEATDGDPVDLVTGEFYHEEKPDIALKSRGTILGLNIVRKYKSRLIYNGPFGFGWAWNHAERLVFLDKTGDGTFDNVNYYDAECIPHEMVRQPDGTYQSPPGITYALSRDGSQYIVTHQNLVKYVFSSEGVLQSKQDSFGNTLTFQYSSGRMTSITDSRGRSLTFAYNTNGKIERVSDSAYPETRYCAYTYTEDDLTSFTNLAGHITHYEYLSNQENPLCDHNMSRYVLPNGDFLELGYYKNDQVAWHKNRKNEIFQFQYSRLNRYGKTWNEEGYYRKVYFNEKHDVIRVMDGTGNLEQLEYDEEHHNMIARTDGNGNRTEFQYYPAGGDPALAAKRLLYSKTNALGEKWEYKYESPNNPYAPSEIKDPKGVITKVEYYATTGALHKKFAAVGYAYNSNGELVETPEAQGLETSYVYDIWGNVLSETDPVGYSIVTAYDEEHVYPVSVKDKNDKLSYFNYDSKGNLVSKKDAEGYTTGFEYDDYGLVTKITNALGKETQFEYDENRRLLTIEDPGGGVVTNVYDIARDLVDGAKIIEKRDQMGRSEYYTYDKVGNLATKKDRNGNITKYEYDGLNRLVAEYDPFGNALWYDYDGNGNVVGAWDRKGKNATTDYDKAGRKTKVTDRRGKYTRFEYDLNGNVIRQIRRLGTEDIVDFLDYDALNRLISKTLALGTDDQRIYQYRYDALGRLVKEIDPLGSYRVYTYDGNGNRIKVEYFAAGGGDSLKEENFAYDKRNRLLKRTDARGKEWKSEYDAVGRKITAIDPAGKLVSYVYDDVGNLVYMVDQKGKVTEHTYDLCNRRIETIDAMNRISSFRYDPNGNLVGVTDPNGNETIAYYDSSNRKIAVQDALRKTTTFDYDENGNQIAQTDPLGRVVRLEYNENDQVKKLKDPPGYFTGDSFTEKIYDDLGRIQEFKDQALHRTLTNYNRLNQKREVREAYGSGDVALTLYDYDQNGNLKNITNAKSAHFQFRYNALNQLTKAFDDCPIADDPTGPSVQFDYDKNGNLKNETRRDGSTVITRIYDDLNRLVEVRRGGEQGELLQSFGYDDLSRMTQAVDYNEGKGTHTVQFEYDELHRVKAEVQDGRRVEKDFDPNGNPVRLRYPSGKAIEREYDALNRMTQIEDGQGGIATFEYWEDGQPKTVAYANGITLSLTYNQVGLERIREYVNAASLYRQTTDVYSKDRNVTQELEAKVGSSSITRDYTYDSQDRIKTENKSGVGQIGAWTYDAVGNWTQTTQNGPTEDRTVNNDNEYTAITGLTPLVYDVHGNLSTSGTSTYVYDWKNRPTEVWDGSTKVAEYTYDALNRRVSKTTQAISVVTTYYYDNAQVIEEHEQGVFKRAYVYGEYVDDPLMMENDQGQDYYYLKDRQYGIRSMADSNGNEVERYEYTAFGRMTIYRNEGGSWVETQESQIGNTYGFTGRQWDKESGLWYYRNRMYSATLGRFLQRDPAGYVDGMNLYAYVKNNPMAYLDPDGLTSQSVSYFNPSAPSVQVQTPQPSAPSLFTDYTAYSPSSGFPSMSYDPLSTISPAPTTVTAYGNTTPAAYNPNESRGRIFYTSETSNASTSSGSSTISGLFSSIVGKKPGDIFTIGFSAGLGIIPIGAGFSVDRVVMPDGKSDWYLTLGFGLSTPGYSFSVDRGKMCKMDLTENQPTFSTKNITKQDIQGFSVSSNVDFAKGIGAGVEGSIAPFSTNEQNGIQYPAPLLTLKGGLRFAPSPGANLFGNWTYDIGD